MSNSIEVINLSKTYNPFKNNEVDWELNQDLSERDFDSSSIEGARVFHQKFGYGTLIDYDGEKANVKFDKSDLKKIFIKYLEFKY